MKSLLIFGALAIAVSASQDAKWMDVWSPQATFRRALFTQVDSVAANIDDVFEDILRSSQWATDEVQVL